MSLGGVAITQVSHSQLSSFENCPQQYKFRYIDRIAAGPPTIEAFLGNQVHAALEELYRQQFFARDLTLAELLEFFERGWGRDLPCDVVRVRSDITTAQFHTLGARYLTEYFQANHPFRASRTLGLEQHIQFWLDAPGGTRVQGYIDRLAEVAPGVLEIHDYKTSMRLPSQPDLDDDRQLALYQIGVEKLWPDTTEVRLVWHYLAFGKTFVSVRTPAQLDELTAATQRTIEEIQMEREFAPRESALCDWCDYQRICPAKRHKFAAAEGAFGELFRDQAAELADRYLELHERRAALDLEMEGLKRDLTAYAEREKLTTLYGQNSRIAVRTYDNYAEPSERDEPERYREWLALLERLGLRDEVSRPNFIRISQLMRRITDPQRRRELERFLRHEKVQRLYPSKQRRRY